MSCVTARDDPVAGRGRAVAKCRVPVSGQSLSSQLECYVGIIVLFITINVSTIWSS